MPRAYERALLAPPKEDEPLLGGSVQSWRVGLVTENLPIDSVLNGLQEAVDIDIDGPGNVRSRGSFLNFGNGTLPGKLISNLIGFIRERETYLAGAFIEDGETDLTDASIWVKKGELDENGDATSWERVDNLNLVNEGDRLHLSRVERWLVITGGEGTDTHNAMRVLDLLDEEEIEDYRISKISNPNKVNLFRPASLYPDNNDIVYRYAITQTAHSPFNGLETQVSPARAVPVSKFRDEWNGTTEQIVVSVGNREAVFLENTTNEESQVVVKSVNLDDFLADPDSTHIKTFGVAGGGGDVDEFRALTQNPLSDTEFYASTLGNKLWKFTLTLAANGFIENQLVSVEVGSYPAACEEAYSITANDDGDLFLIEEEGNLWRINPSSPSDTTGIYGLIGNVNDFDNVNLSEGNERGLIAFQRETAESRGIYSWLPNTDLPIRCTHPYINLMKTL